MENPTSFARSVKKSRNYSFGAICREQFFLLLICVLFAGKSLTQGQIAEDKFFIPTVVMVPDSDEHIGAPSAVLPAQSERNESLLFATQRKAIPPKALQSEGRIRPEPLGQKPEGLILPWSGTNPLLTPADASPLLHSRQPALPPPWSGQPRLIHHAAVTTDDGPDIPSVLPAGSYATGSSRARRMAVHPLTARGPPHNTVPCVLL